MGSIRISETSQVGEAYSTVEYEFSDASDFFAWDEIKREAINNAVKSFVGGVYGENPLEEPADNVAEIKVSKKKEKLH
jgi:hypothetical protein